MSNHPVGPRLESSLDQVCSLRKHEGEGDQTPLRGGLQALGPLCERMDHWGGAGEGPVTKVERRRLPEEVLRIGPDPGGPSTAISFGRPTVCAALYLRYASAALIFYCILGEWIRAYPADGLFDGTPGKWFQIFHYLLLSIFFFKQNFKRFTQCYTVNTL